jgi:hypothetical protein
LFGVPGATQFTTAASPEASTVSGELLFAHVSPEGSVLAGQLAGMGAGTTGPSWTGTPVNATPNDRASQLTDGSTCPSIKISAWLQKYCFSRG